MAKASVWVGPSCRSEPIRRRSSSVRAVVRGRRLADPVVQPRVLVEQGRELADLLAELALLAEDRLAALANDAGEGQVGEDGRSGDQAPRDQAVPVDLGLQLVGELVELGHGDDLRRSRARTGR